MMRRGKVPKLNNSIQPEEAKVSRPSKKNTWAEWNALGVSIFALMLLFVIPTASAQAQAPGACSTLDAPPTGIAPPGDALRPGHLGRQVENEEEITHFYHELIGLEIRGNREQPRAFGQNRGLQEVASLVQG